jgi:site-specific recombinase XerD
MNILINNNTSVEITYTPKKNKTDKTKYAIYMQFKVYEKGLKKYEHSIATGITCEIDEYKDGEMIGRSERAKLINGRLFEYNSTASNMLDELKIKKTITAKQVYDEIEDNAKQRITGKAPKGKKTMRISTLKSYSYENIVAKYLAEKKLSTSRTRNFERTIKYINEFFKDETPTIDDIARKDLENFKTWFLETYQMKPNSSATYLGIIAAVFNYALYNDVIQKTPIPKGFIGSFEDANRLTLSDSEVLKIMQLVDENLSKTLQIAKYSLLVQTLTGLGYGDLKAFEHENIKYHENSNTYSIEKNRNKTGIIIREALTPKALSMVEKLKELTGNDAKPFNLPSIEYISRKYKEIGRLAKVDTPITTYTLRHTYAIDYMNNDGSLEDLKENLGHKDTKYTAIYGKISNQRLVKKANHLASVSKIHQMHTKENYLKVVYN